MSLRHDLRRFRTQSEALETLGGMPSGPAHLTHWAEHLYPGFFPGTWPKYATKSDSGLFTYQGPVLGIRQVVIAVARHTGQPLPPGFNEAPPRLLAIMGLTLPSALVEVDHKLPFAPVPKNKLPDTVESVIDLWESTGLSWLARPCFFLSHFYHTTGWFPLTPQMEGFHR